MPFRGRSAASRWPGNGTLFLDEIGDMSLSMQSKFLRVLQERTLERVGGTKPVSVYCRLIAATNKELTELRKSGAFREDLFYRLSTVTLKLPRLRERTRDIPALVRLFIDEANASYGKHVQRVPEPLLRRLETYPWPGNIRQLKNVIVNAVIMSDGEEISSLQFGDGALATDEIQLQGDLRSTIEHYAADLERRLIRSVLEASGRNVTRAASRLGVSRKTLYDKMRRHGL